MRLQEHGLIDYSARRNNVLLNLKTYRFKSTDGKHKALGGKDVIGAFELLGACYAITTLVFLAELLRHRLRQ